MNFIYCSCIDALSNEQLYCQRYLLSHSQQAIFDKLRLDNDKRRTLLGKMLLRYALKKHEGYYETRFPELHYNPYGKPAVTGMKGGFNISHAGSWVVCAYATEGDIGVDIEQRKPVDIHDYKSVLTPDEFISLTHSNKLDFFQLWTLKEAIIKADGRGFYLSPTSFTLPDVWLNHNDITVAGKCWYLYSKDVEDQYVLSAALPSKRSALLRISISQLLC